MNALKLVIQFVLVVALQVLVLNNIELFGYMNPYLYVVYIIMLPANMNRNALLYASVKKAPFALIRWFRAGEARCDNR